MKRKRRPNRSKADIAKGDELRKMREHLRLKAIAVSKLSGIPFQLLWDMECGRFPSSDKWEVLLRGFYQNYYREDSPLIEDEREFFFWIWLVFLKRDPLKYPHKHPRWYRENQEEYYGGF